MFMNKKAISTLTLIILIVASAIVGGIISYMLTIAYYVEMGYNIPENTTTLAITGVYIDPEDAASFRVTILNPSFSISNATVTRIAVSPANETNLYEVVETQPPIEDGLVIHRGKAINITCSALQINEKKMSWGEFAYKFAGQSITIHVFSSNASAANKEVTLPYVKLEVIPDFRPEITFESFNITLKNDEKSETNLTITTISLAEPTVNYTIRQMIWEPELRSITPNLPYTLDAGENETFKCELNWLGVSDAKIKITTEEGYEIYHKVALMPMQTYFTIQDVIFDEDDTEHFKVIVKNEFGLAEGITVTNITYTIKNGTTMPAENINPALPAIVPPTGQNFTFTCSWNWHDYRGKEVNVTVYLKQGFVRSIKVTTPKPVILEILNLKDVFKLENKTYFSVNLRNHASSLETINITKKKVEEITIDHSKTSSLPCILKPGENITITCNLGKSWTDYQKESLNLVVEFIGNESQTNSETFVVLLPEKAKLNITSVKHVVLGTKNYLNITVENMHYSAINLTISKIIVTFENQTEPSIMQLSPGLTVAIGSETFIFFPTETAPQGDITVEVITDEGIEASWSGVPGS